MLGKKVFIFHFLFISLTLSAQQIIHNDFNIKKIKNLEFNNNDFSDFYRLDSIIGNARLIGVGESVHGSLNYLKFQYKYLKFLILKRGIRLVFLENPIRRSIPISRYVKSCKGNISDVLKALYFPSAEDEQFLKWLCRYNSRVPKKKRVSVRGFDTWERPWELQRKLEDYSSLVNSLKLKEGLSLMRGNCVAHDDRRDSWEHFRENDLPKIRELKRIPVKRYIPCKRGQRITLNFLLRAKKQLISRFGKWKYYNALTLINTSIAWHDGWDLRLRDFKKGWLARDKAQAQNIFAILKQEGTFKRAVVLAHTSHVNKRGNLADWWKLGGLQSAGYFLRRELGKNYKTIGLTGYKIAGLQFEDFFSTPKSKDSLDLYLRRRSDGKSTYFVNVKGKTASKKEKWWLQNENHSSHYVDGVFLNPKVHYDLLVYFDYSPLPEPRERGNSPFYP